MRIETTES